MRKTQSKIKKVNNGSKKNTPMAAAFKVPSSIHTGDYFKGYKELTEALGIEYKRGTKNQKYQLKDIGRYLEVIKDEDSSAYVIGEIYDKPLPKEYVANNSIYSKCIELLLLKLLADSDGNSINKTSKQLYRDLGMLNIKYIECEENKKDAIKLFNNCNMEMNDINTFFAESRTKLYEILYNSLRSLQDRYIIKHEKVFNIGKRNSNGIIEYKIIYQDDQDTIEKILEIHNTALKELGLKKKQQVYILKKQDEFFSIVSREAKKYGWDIIYESHSIVYNKLGVINAISDIEYELNKMMLNNKVLNSMYAMVDKNIEKKKREYMIMEKVLDGEDADELSKNKKSIDVSHIEDDEEQAKYRRVQYFLINELLSIQNVK